MGVDYRGQLCVGYTYDEAFAIFESSEYEGDFEDFIEQEGLESFAPYYDARNEDCIYGQSLAQSSDYDFKTVDISYILDSNQELVDNLIQQFKLEPNTYLMARGW